MKLRIVGYIFVLCSFLWIMVILWPALCGNYWFMPARPYRAPKDTGEMVPRHELVMHGQFVLDLCHRERSQILRPLLLMLVGAVALDLAGRRQRKTESPNKTPQATSL